VSSVNIYAAWYGERKRLELCQLYVTWLPVRDLEDFRLLDFSWTEGTYMTCFYRSLVICRSPFATLCTWPLTLGELLHQPVAPVTDLQSLWSSCRDPPDICDSPVPCSYTTTPFMRCNRSVTFCAKGDLIDKYMFRINLRILPSSTVEHSGRLVTGSGSSAGTLPCRQRMGFVY
jgi:hypothetical protein